MTVSGLEFSILLPAFLAGLLVLASHVPLGMQVLARGIVFIDLAIAQIAGLGVIAADLMGLDAQGWAVQLAAVSAALVGGLWLTYAERRWPEVQEALIGVLFVLAATASILLLAHNPHGGEHLKDLLVGQILWVSYSQLSLSGVVSALVVALWFGARSHLARLGFYVLFAFAVTVSVQLVGVYLVFASLIIPALATRHYTAKRLAMAYGLGALAYALGLLASAWWDLPSGAVIVWSMALLGIVVYALGPARTTAPGGPGRHPS